MHITWLLLRSFAWMKDETTIDHNQTETMNSLIKSHGYRLRSEFPFELLVCGGTKLAQKTVGLPERLFKRTQSKVFIQCFNLEKSELQHRAIQTIQAELDVLLAIYGAPCFLNITDLFFAGKEVNIVTECAERGSLGALAGKEKIGCFKEKAALEYFREAAFAIKELHRKGISHGNLAADTIFVTKDKKIKVGGFFLASTRLLLEEKVRSPGRRVTAYTAPELLDENQEADDLQAADIWSLGITFYYLLNGKFPFNLKTLASDQLAFFRKQSRLKFRPQTSNKCQSLILSMLAQDPAARPNIWQLLKSECLLSKEPKQFKPFCDEQLAKLRVMREKVEALKDHLSILSPSPSRDREVPPDNSSYVVILREELGHYDFRHTVVGSHVALREEPLSEIAKIDSDVEVLDSSSSSFLEHSSDLEEYNRHLDQSSPSSITTSNNNKDNADTDNSIESTSKDGLMNYANLDQSSPSSITTSNNNKDNTDTDNSIESTSKDGLMNYANLDQSSSSSSSDSFTNFVHDRLTTSNNNKDNTDTYNSKEKNKEVGDCPPRKKKTRIRSAFKKVKKLFG